VKGVPRSPRIPAVPPGRSPPAGIPRDRRTRSPGAHRGCRPGRGTGWPPARARRRLPGSGRWRPAWPRCGCRDLWRDPRAGRPSCAGRSASRESSAPSCRTGRAGSRCCPPRDRRRKRFGIAPAASRSGGFRPTPGSRPPPVRASPGHPSGPRTGRPRGPTRRAGCPCRRCSGCPTVPSRAMGAVPCGPAHRQGPALRLADPDAIRGGADRCGPQADEPRAGPADPLPARAIPEVAPSVQQVRLRARPGVARAAPVRTERLVGCVDPPSRVKTRVGVERDGRSNCATDVRAVRTLRDRARERAKDSGDPLSGARSRLRAPRRRDAPGESARSPPDGLRPAPPGRKRDLPLAGDLVTWPESAAALAPADCTRREAARSAPARDPRRAAAAAQGSSSGSSRAWQGRAAARRRPRGRRRRRWP
jgi:hypothetical protein